jgi:glycosyltransferase involved in cell wall biosynthesis
MKILLITSSQQAESVAPVAEGLRGRGLEVEMVEVGFSRGKGWLSVAMERQGSVTELNISGRLANWINGHYPLLLRIFRKRLVPMMEKGTVLHAFGLHPLGAVGKRLAEETGARFVLSPTAQELLNGLGHLPRSSWREAAFSAADSVVIESEFLREKIPAARNVAVIPSFVSDEGLGFRPRPQGSSLYFVMAGRWDDEQPVIARPKLAMKALAQVEEELGRPVILGIIGGGTRTSELKHYCAGLNLHGQFHGELDGTALARELQRADLFLHPTDFATFPMRMAQAMKCGVPVLASDVTGMEGFIGGEANGLLVENKLSAWKDGILRATQTDFDHGAIASFNRERFSLEETVSSLERVYSLEITH